jgi:prolyl oligopeptidase
MDVKMLQQAKGGGPYAHGRNHCLRGGSEYGEEWHHAGWREKKQTVFDDYIAAAEWLQATGYTSADRCALHGVSNGGLLVGAVITQRPGLTLPLYTVAINPL